MEKRNQGAQGLLPFFVAAALVLGGLGGYALRGTSVATSQAAAANDDGRTGVVPRSLREDSGITPFQAPAPRWTHEDDVIGSATK